VAAEGARSPRWRIVGLVGIAAGFIILSYYAVIAGMTMAYVPHALISGFGGADAAKTAADFAALTGSPVTLGLWQAAFLAISAAVVARGVKGGIEAACAILMPLLGLLMVALVIYAAIEGDVARAADFMFSLRLDQLSPRGALEALGLGFFSIGVGMGVMITYAAYAGERFDLARAAIATLIGDTAISLLAGFAIFPIVFAEGLDPSEGASLMFLTLPLAFGALPFGDLVGAAFFLLLFVAALASAISLIEVAVAPLMRTTAMSRRKAAILVGAVAWLLGLPSVLSFNLWAEVRPLSSLGHAELTIFDAIDGFASNLLLPACGLALSLFAGWRMPAHIYQAELGQAPRALGTALRLLLRWVVPAVIIAYVAAAQVVRF
jgi:NSS family neurotransmitter:Na+ symporter